MWTVICRIYEIYWDLCSRQQATKGLCKTVFGYCDLNKLFLRVTQHKADVAPLFSLIKSTVNVFPMYLYLRGVLSRRKHLTDTNRRLFCAFFCVWAAQRCTISHTHLPCCGWRRERRRFLMAVNPRRDSRLGLNRCCLPVSLSLSLSCVFCFLFVDPPSDTWHYPAGWRCLGNLITCYLDLLSTCDQSVLRPDCSGQCLCCCFFRSVIRILAFLHTEHFIVLMLFANMQYHIAVNQ